MISIASLFLILPGINVPRRRFLPVKLTSDLLLVMSNLYTLDSGTLSLSVKRQFPGVPLVKLGQDKFKKVRCRHFTVLLVFTVVISEFDNQSYSACNSHMPEV